MTELNIYINYKASTKPDQTSVKLLWLLHLTWVIKAKAT